MIINIDIYIYIDIYNDILKINVETDNDIYNLYIKNFEELEFYKKQIFIKISIIIY